MQDGPLPFKNLADPAVTIFRSSAIGSTNWAAYDAGLRGRGSLTIWFTEAAIATWRPAPRTTRGGRPRYSSLATTTALTLRAVFRLALRRTEEDSIGSIIALLGLDLATPDHSTLSRRAEASWRYRGCSRTRYPSICWWTARVCGSAGRASGWSRSMVRRDDARGGNCISVRMPNTGQIVAAELTTHDIDDGSQVGPLLEEVARPVASFTGDGAYDRDDVYSEVTERHPDATVIVAAAIGGSAECSGQYHAERSAIGIFS